jgi:hypothetical protein
MPRICEQVQAGTGILTRCPSPTLIRLGLGPTNPGLIIMAQETSLFRWQGFSPCLWLLIPAFSLGNAPPNLPVRLRRDTNAPLPLHKGRIQCKAHIFGNMLEPRYIFRAGSLDK